MAKRRAAAVETDGALRVRALEAVVPHLATEEERGRILRPGQEPPKIEVVGEAITDDDDGAEVYSALLIRVDAPDVLGLARVVLGRGEAEADVHVVWMEADEAVRVGRACLVWASALADVLGAPGEAVDAARELVGRARRAASVIVEPFRKGGRA